MDCLHMFCRSWFIGYQSKVPFISQDVQHDEGEGYQKPITFRRVSQSGQVEIKIGYLYSYTLNLIPITLYTELDNVAP